MRKVMSAVVIFILIININIITLADDLEEETINEDEIKEEILNVSTNVENFPKVNSRAALIFDRTSKRVIYEKKRLFQTSNGIHYKNNVSNCNIRKQQPSRYSRNIEKSRRNRRVKIRLKSTR